MVSVEHVKEFQTIFGYRTSGNETIISLMTTIQGQHTNAHERDKFHHDENTKRVSSNSMSPFENVNIIPVFSGAGFGSDTLKTIFKYVSNFLEYLPTLSIFKNPSSNK